MVWGCFSGQGVGSLDLIDGIMDKKVFTDILIEELQYSADLMGIGDNFVFQQDNDPKHTSGLAKNWLTDNGIECLEWVAQSPDMNPIENLWKILDESVPLRQRTNKKRFFEALKKEWYSMDKDLLKRLVDSVPRRLNDVIKAKGGPTGN